MTRAVLAGTAGFLLGDSSLGVFQISVRKAADLAITRKFMWYEAEFFSEF